PAWSERSAISARSAGRSATASMFSRAAERSFRSAATSGFTTLQVTPRGGGSHRYGIQQLARRPDAGLREVGRRLAVRVALRARGRAGDRAPFEVGLAAGAHQLGPLSRGERPRVQQAQYERAAQAVGAPAGGDPRAERALAQRGEHVLLRRPRPLLTALEQTGHRERGQLPVDLAAGHREERPEALLRGGDQLPTRHRALVQETEQRGGGGVHSGSSGGGHAGHRAKRSRGSPRPGGAVSGTSRPADASPRPRRRRPRVSARIPGGEDGAPGRDPRRQGDAWSGSWPAAWSTTSRSA